MKALLSMNPSLLKGKLLAAALAVCAMFPAARAETEIVFPAEDTFITGGSRSGEDPADRSLLLVAARTQSTLEHVRKIFLLFETDSGSEAVEKAALTLTHHGLRVVSNDGDPRMPIDLRLYGAAGGDWTEQNLTWDSAPFHDPQSFSEESNPALELLAEITVDPSNVSEDDVLTFSDPRLTEFVRKNPGRNTFVVTSVAAPNSPGLVFFDADATGRPDRKPRLVLETK
jgi:hypothetical protein